MKANSPSLKFVILAVMIIMAAVLACSSKLDEGAGATLRIQQTMVSLKLTQNSMGTQMPDDPAQTPEVVIEDTKPPDTPTEEAHITEPLETATEEPSAPTETQGVAYEGISFSLDQTIANSVAFLTVPGQNMGDDFMPSETYPTHFEFTFENYAVGDHFHDPMIRVYPVNEYRNISPHASDIITALQDALVNRPGGGNLSNLPFLPMWNAAQFFSAKVGYLDFQSGSGVRYLTMYGQGLSPVDNQNLFYTFQGLTQDNRFYVTAIMPITHFELPEDGYSLVDDPTAFYDDWDRYISETIQWLQAQDPATFTPNLNKLDAMMASIKISR